MQETTYGLHVELPVNYEQALERATAALKEQGFGVLTTIDVKQTLKQKLDRDFRKYVILGDGSARGDEHCRRQSEAEGCREGGRRPVAQRAGNAREGRNVIGRRHSGNGTSPQ